MQHGPFDRSLRDLAVTNGNKLNVGASNYMRQEDTGHILSNFRWENVIIISLIGSFRLSLNYDPSHVAYTEPKKFVFNHEGARWTMIIANVASYF